MNLPFLTLLTFIPLVGSLILLFVPKTAVKAIRWIAAITSFIPVILVVWMWGMWYSVPAAESGMKFVEKFTWIPSLGVQYYFGVDGIGFSLVALTAIVSFLAALASFSIENRVKDYFVLFLLLETGMMGVFAALDYVLFYVFWELVLVPMYFLIGIWGGPRREYAAIKFFIYTLVGSVIMLVGILAMYFASGAKSFDILWMAQQKFNPTFQWWVFLALFLGFAVKVPVFPFHTWLPDAHVEAPTPISMILAGVLLKMGTYGFVRISHPTLPVAAKAFTMMFIVLGLINLIYGALTAMAQKDLKKLVAYSSISHMGFVLIGMAAATPSAINGAVYQMFSHGLISAMMFFMVGVFYERLHTREIAKLSGLYTAMPVAATFMAFSAFANLGLPGLSGFIAEFSVLYGTWPVFPKVVLISTLGMLVVAAFNLWMMQRVLMGVPKPDYHHLTDANPREMTVAIALTLGVALFGIVPSLLMNLLNPAVLQVVAKLAGGM